MAEAVAGRALYQLAGDLTDLRAKLAEARKEIQTEGAKAEQDAKTSIGKLGTLSASAKLAIVGVGAAVGAIGGIAIEMGQQYAQGTNNIIKQTGASGAALEGLQQSMKNLAGQVPESLGVVGDAIGQVNTRLGLTGQPLEDITRKFLDLARVTKTDVSQDITDVTRLFGDWSVKTEDQSLTMDKLLKISQDTGVGINALSQTVVEFGAPMRALGISMDDAIALTGKWEKEGVNITTVMSGMRLAVANFAKQGIDPATGFPAVIDEIKGLDDAQGLLKAKQIVGQRAANDFFRAIKEGRFDVQDLTADMQTAGGTIDDTTSRTETWAEKFQKFFNGITAQVGPITGQIGDLGMGLQGLKLIITPVGTALGALAGLFVSSFQGLAGKVVGTAAAAGAEIGVATGEAESVAQAESATGTGALARLVAGIGAMQIPLAAEGTTLGEVVGGAVSTGIALGIVTVGGVVIAGAVVVAMNDAKNKIDNDPKSLTAADMLDARAPVWAQKKVAIAKQMQDMGQAALDAFNQTWRDGIAKGMDASDPALLKAAEDAGTAAGSAQAQASWNAFRQGERDALPVIEAAAADASDSFVQALLNENIPQQWAEVLATQAQDVDKQGGFKKFTDPAVQSAYEAVQNIVSLMGEGVPQGIATALQANGGQISDALYAVMNGIDPSQIDLAPLYEKLNVPQALAVRWAATGPFDIAAGLSFVIQQAQAGKVITDALQKSVLDEAAAQGLIPQAAVDLWEGKAIGPFSLLGANIGKAAGAAVDKGTAAGLIANAGEVASAAEQVHQDLLNALGGKQSVTEATAKKTLEWFSQGIKSADPKTKADSQQLGLDALAALSEAMQNGNGGKNGAKDVGIYFDALVASGIDANSIVASLKAGGVSDDAIAALEKRYPQFFQTGSAFDSKVAQGVKDNAGALDGPLATVSSKFDLDTKTWGYRVGDSWITGFANAIRGGASTISTAIDKATRATHGQSPPKEGPLREIDKWGFNIGQAWSGGFAKGLRADLPSLSGISIAPALASVGSAVAPSLSGPREVHYHYHVDVKGLVEARTPDDIGRALRRIGSMGLAKLPVSTTGAPV